MLRRLLLGLALALTAVISVGIATAGDSEPAGKNAAAPTWDSVAPVFAEKCASCHRLGGIAPFSLTDAKTARAHASRIALLTRLRAMPPWMPGADSPSYQGQAHRILTADEIALIGSWAKAGGKLGSGKAIKPAAQPQTAPGSTTTLQMARAYRPHGTGGSTDDYHCSLLDPRLTQNAFVTSAVVKPQQTAVVHHVILFDATGANVAAARALNARSGGNGWTCFGGPGLSETRASADTTTTEALGAPQWISAWVPGHVTNDLPQGTGVLMHAGDVVVMQVHYNLLKDTRQKLVDRSSVILRTTPAATTNLIPLTTYLLPAPVELPCPSGANGPQCTRQSAFDAEVKHYGADAAVLPLGLLYLCKQTLQQAQGTSSSCARTVTRPLRIYGAAGHMHLRGVDIRVELNGATLLHIPNWSFHWQDAYYLDQPVDANVGDTLRVSCTFDPTRSKPYRYVLWGEGTTDEMCLGLLQVAGR